MAWGMATSGANENNNSKTDSGSNSNTDTNTNTDANADTSAKTMTWDDSCNYYCAIISMTTINTEFTSIHSTK